jgi:hypothetical protein
LFAWQKASTHAMTTKLLKPAAHMYPLDTIYKRYDEETGETYLFSRNGHVTLGGLEVIDANPNVTYDVT